MRARFKSAILSMALGAAPAIGLAQSAPVEAGGTRTASGDGSKPVTLTQTVEPTFRIEPVVLRFAARRGEIIPFEFTITSLGKGMDVTVEPVNLRQEATGIILHDKTSTPARDLKISSEKRFTLGAGADRKITGELTVPLAKSNYLSYGILVREAGRAPEYNPDDKSETKAGIRFVTQYVLRVDVETGVADPAALKSMKLERGQLIAVRGLPVVRAYLTNPTDYSFECRVGATCAAKSEGKVPPIPLGMASRKTLDGDERTLVRIMPKSTLMLEGGVDHLIATGAQLIHVGVMGDRREVVAAEFNVEIHEESFPGLAPTRAIVGEGLLAAPAQLEVGSVTGFKRSSALRLSNSSTAAQKVSLDVLSLSGEAIDDVRLSPHVMTLAAGGAKTIRAMLMGVADESQCGVIRIRASAADGKVHEQRLPLSILRQPRPAPHIDVSNVDLAKNQGRQAFTVLVTNKSATYVPIHATLDGQGPNGTRFSLEAGYGMWLQPGEEKRFTFEPTDALTSGEYQLALELKSFAEAAPIVRELTIGLASAEGAAPLEANEPTRAGG